MKLLCGLFSFVLRSVFLVFLKSVRQGFVNEQQQAEEQSRQLNDHCRRHLLPVALIRQMHAAQYLCIRQVYRWMCNNNERTGISH